MAGAFGDPSAGWGGRDFGPARRRRGRPGFGGGAASGKPLQLSGFYAHSLVWEPNGRFVAVGGALGPALGGAALLYEVEPQKVLQPPMLHADPVNAVAFHPGGGLLATACQDGTVRLWDVPTGTRRPTVLKHPYPATAVSFSKDGQMVVTGCGMRQSDRVGPGEARLWDLATGELLVQPLVHRGPGNVSTVRGAAVTDGGSTILTASENGRVWRWTISGLARPRVVRSEGAAEKGVGFTQELGSRIAFSPDGSTLLLRSLGGDPKRSPDEPSQLRLFDVATGAPTGQVLSQPPARVQFSPDGRLVLTVPYVKSRDRVLRLWNASTGEPVSLPPALARDVRWAGYSPDGNKLLTGGEGGRFRVWDGSTLQPCSGPLDHGAAITWLAPAPDGRTILTAGTDRTVRVWDVVERRELAPPLSLPGCHPESGFFTADSTTVVLHWRQFTPYDNRTYHRRYATDGRALGEPQEEGIAGLIPSADGNLFAVRTLDGWGVSLSGRLWDVRAGKHLGPAMPPCNPIAFHPSNRFMALCSGSSGNVVLWSVTGKPIGPPVLHAGQVIETRFDPSGRVLATVCADNACRLWSVPAPISGTPAQVRQLIESLTGQELDEAGGFSDWRHN
jgi:WD40 repeat protein